MQKTFSAHLAERKTLIWWCEWTRVMWERRTLALWYEIGGGQADAQEGQAGLGLVVHHCLLLLHTDACAEHGLPCLRVPIMQSCLQGKTTRAAQGQLQW